MKKLLCLILALVMVIGVTGCGAETKIEGGVDEIAPELIAEKAEPGEMRRPLSNEQPMLIVHIDTWNSADPQAIIDLIPEKVLPYCVFNISLSVSHDEDTGEFRLTGTPYELIKSWIRTCAENNVWCLVQPASGGFSNLPDYNSETDYEETIFAEFFRDYPNFLGFNYCEQFWGFNEVDGSLVSPTIEQRYDHFVELLKLCDKYGGYLVVSWCGNMWGQSINPIAMLKTHPAWEEAARTYSDHYILCDKYTQEAYKHDVQSSVFGSFLSGYCDNFGVRYDSTAWTQMIDGEFTSSTGFSVMLEDMLLNGATVIDGPELIPDQCFRESREIVTDEGYTQRVWETYSQYRNGVLDIFAKIADGEFYIPTREEVIARTKVAMVQDVSTGTDDAMYCTPVDLFTGLYRMENDGGLRDNFYHYKTNGRYPTIPEVVGFTNTDYELGFDHVINISEYRKLWKTTEDKVAFFNEVFPEEYTGDMYAGRYKNTWWTYSYYLKNEVATAKIPLKYNTCDELELSYRKYGSGVVTEYSDHIDFYLNNYDENSVIKTLEETITIKGATEKPIYEAVDRADHIVSNFSETWENGVYTLTVTHNGPVDITINCSGSATDRLTDIATTNIKTPLFAPNYDGDLQYEGEFYSIMNVNGYVKNGFRTGADGYTGQGYLDFGLKDGASAYDIVTVREGGEYELVLRYRVNADVNNLNIKVNGKKYSIDLPKTSGWSTASVNISLKDGANKVEFLAAGALGGNLLIDNFVIVR